MARDLRRNDVAWADLGPPAGRRPVVVLTRDVAIPLLDRIVVVPVTRTRRGIATEIILGRDEGLREESVAACDTILTVPRRVVGPRIGRLGMEKRAALDAAIRFALDIRY